MKQWETLQYLLQSAKEAKEKKQLRMAVQKFIEEASVAELKEISGVAGDEFLRQQAEIELWWKDFEKTPGNLLDVIRDSHNENKIGKAIIKLGNMKCWDSVDVLITFLTVNRLRDSAALALREMPTQKTLKPIVEAIQRNPDGAECLLYALQVLDCSDAAEFLVELFISKPKALVVRDDIYTCFSKKAVRKVTRPTKVACCSKLAKAIEKSEDQNDIKELKQLYDALLEIEEFVTVHRF